MQVTVLNNKGVVQDDCAIIFTTEDPDVTQVEPPAGLHLKGPVGQVPVERRQAQRTADHGHGAAHGDGDGDVVDGVRDEGDDAAARI